ncbi:hypothetical protein SAMN05192553_103405 [Cyclobacterium xiamenense]|uniref:Tetratricopeptide repeat-containing protein n=1 Tax=Cyclobacterium xiamenense TaxID=1297121 RepID=A0A1H6YD30_9BACT|nr:hypothetical protein [Cyclobacterium xiamenense]SEJ35102.1 hypothetical protein SAMN05192553_103405 [Cyclobacterium xiamenense]
MISNFRKDSLFDLIASLAPSEKRNFTLFARRLSSNQGAKFLQLFEAMEKMETYDERQLLEKVPVTKKQLPNMKAHLYKQLLTSLRLLYADRNIELQLNEQIDFGRILFNKGLYMQSLKLLDKAKQMAREYGLDTVMLRVVEMEKVIESQHITRSIRNRAEVLSRESAALSENVDLKNRFSSLSLQLYGIYLKTGYIKDREGQLMLERFYKQNMPAFDLAALGFYEKMYLYQAQVWYFHIIQDFPLCYRAAQHWVDLFHASPHMINVASGNYLKAYHYLLDTLFYLGYYDRFSQVLEEFQASLESSAFVMDDNSRILAFLYLYSNLVNIHFLKGEFTRGVEQVVPALLKDMKPIRSKLDVHHLMVLHYKVACLYFGHGDNEKTIYYLDQVIQNNQDGLREDLQCFAHILKLIASYEAGKDEKLDGQIRNVYRFLIKMDDLHQVQKEMVRFVRNLSRIYDHELKAAFIELREKLIVYEHHPYEKRAFLYLDIISWLESKIENRPVQQIIRQKFLEKSLLEKEK